jgi:prepilin-type N-terminal cleavage/methylation domain-containing protein/prepilin-type processing-associated H-X9-DG protein
MRRRGFTLIELLVVIAIIGILAAMLFPVFARARESARKTQCLSNVKNIAMAVQIYLTDYQMLPPKGNHDQDLVDFLCCHQACLGNPYVRWPVVLDEYTKSREVWRCPSARMSYGPQFIVPQYTSVWWWYLRDNPDKWGSDSPAGGTCELAYPTGWGGTVTDSIAQQQRAGAVGDRSSTGAPELTIGVNNQWPELKESQLGDPSSFVVVGDAMKPMRPGEINSPDSVMYGVCGGNYFVPANSCAIADWSNCSWTQQCGLDSSLDPVKLWSDSTFRMKYPRHMGGANVGFLDGHAKWWAADAFMAQAPYCDGTNTYTEGRSLRGLCPTTAGPS